MAARGLDPHMVEELAGRIGRHIREALSGVTVPPPTTETPAALAETVLALRYAGSQTDVLRALLRGAGGCGARAALFVHKNDRLEGWESVGFESEPSLAGVIAGVRLGADHPTVAALLSKQQPVHAEVGGAYGVPDFGQTVRGEALLAPVVVNGRIAGVLYADPASGDAAFDRRAVKVLAEIAGLAVERQVLAKALGRTGAETSPPAASPAPARGPAQPTVSQPVASPFAAPRPVASRPTKPEPAASPPVDRVMTSGSVARPAVDWTQSAAPETGESAEVEDARRYCRLLMDEILLYHGDKVEEGRSHRDLANRLADELAKARQLYERRVEARVRESGDYFEEAIVRKLAGGDARLLGAPQGQAT